MKKIYSGIMLFLILLIGVVALQLFQQNKEIDSVAKIKKQVEKASEGQKETTVIGQLQIEYPGLVAWLEVGGTDIALPVMQGQDNEYYLTHAPNGAYSDLGSVFIDAAAKKDFTDKNTFIYGHNVWNGEGMFSFIENYLSYDYYKQHPTLRLLVDGKVITADIFSVYKDDWNSRSYQPSIHDDISMNEYLKIVMEKRLYDTGIKVSALDNIITLYTCSFEGMQEFDPANTKERYYLHAVIRTK